MSDTGMYDTGSPLDLEDIRRKALSRADGYGILNPDVFDAILVVPKMIDEIERLRAENARLGSGYSGTRRTRVGGPQTTC